MIVKVLSEKRGRRMNKSEFADAVKRNDQRLFLIALSFTRSRADAEDILQNVFLKLWQNKKVFESAEHMDKWLTRVCVNESRNLLRSPFRSRVTELEDAADIQVFDSPRDGDLFRAVMSLQEKERTVIHLFYYEDLSVAEIAKTLRISPSAVKTRLNRARNKLKEALGDEWKNEP